MKYRMMKHPLGSWSLYKEVNGGWEQQGLREYKQRDLLHHIPFEVGTTVEIEVREVGEN